MNDSSPPHAAELCLQQLIDTTEDYVRREPDKSVAAALGAGLLLKVLPKRPVIRVLTSVAAQILPTTLLGLGVLKAFELCCQKSSHPSDLALSVDSP